MSERDPEAAAIAACRARIEDIDETIAHLDARRAQLVAEAESLGLTIEAATNPSLLNRGSKR